MDFKNDTGVRFPRNRFKAMRKKIIEKWGSIEARLVSFSAIVKIHDSSAGAHLAMLLSSDIAFTQAARKIVKIDIWKENINHESESLSSEKELLNKICLHKYLICTYCNLKARGKVIFHFAKYVTVRVTLETRKLTG